MASLWTSKTQSGRNNCGKDSCVLNLQYCCENVGLYNQYDDPHSSSPSTTFIIPHHCSSYNWLYYWSRSIRKAAADAAETTDAAGCSCCTREKYCHHYSLFLSRSRHVFDAFNCNIHHEERYLKFADISFENIDTAKKYRNNIDTFLRQYPSPIAWQPCGRTSWHDIINPLPRAGVRTLQTLWRQLHNGHVASMGPKACPCRCLNEGREEVGGGGGEGGDREWRGDSFLGVDEGDRAEGRGLIGGGDKLAFWSNWPLTSALTKLSCLSTQDNQQKSFVGMALYYIKATPITKLWQATHNKMGRLKWGGCQKGRGGGGYGKGLQCMTMLVMEHGPSHILL